MKSRTTILPIYRLFLIMAAALFIGATPAKKFPAPTLIKTLPGHADSISAMCMSRDDKLIASAGRDQMIKIWDVASGAELLSFKAHKHEILDMAFSPDAKILATASFDETIKIWDVATGKMLYDLSPPHDEIVGWERFTPPQFEYVKQIFGTYDQFRWAWSVTFTPDGRTMITGTGENTVTLWDTSDFHVKKTIRKYDNMGRELAVSPDGSMLATVGYHDEVKVELSKEGDMDVVSMTHVEVDFQTAVIFDLATGKEIRSFEEFDNQGYTNLIFNGDGTQLMGCGAVYIIVWDVATGKILHKLCRCFPDGGYKIWDFSAIALMKDENILVGASSYKYILFYDVASEKEVLAYKASEDGIYRMLISGDKTFMVTCSADNAIKIWRLKQ